MTAWLGALLLVIGVLVLCKALGIVARSRSAIALAQESFVVISDRALAEEQKEEVLQRNALRLFKLFAILLLAGAVAFGVPLAGLWLADRVGALSWDDVLATTLSWPFLTGTVLATALALVVLRRRRPPVGPADEAGFENRYSAADRWLHHLAFASAPVQGALARVEDRVFRRRLARVASDQPVFITSLPRAGTTLLLNCCAAVDEFVTHTYRQMPFVLTPVFWERFSRRFRVADVPRERAHGDGMLVSADSPEALEEMLWLSFWPEHYQADRIRPWSEDEEQAQFETFFRRHMAKLALIREGESETSPSPRRYVSKNNGNIARIPWLAHAFPEARFVIPFRPPLQHAASLLRQHRNFLEIHQRDPFARHYMAGIGHFDFGANLRPVNFGGWLDARGSAAPTELEFWIRYWTAAYGELIAQLGDRVRLVDYDALCREPANGLESLAKFLNINERESFLRVAGTIRPPRPHAVDDGAVPHPVLESARALHAMMVTQAGRMADVDSSA